MPGTLPSIPAPPSDQTSLLSWAAVVTTYLRNLRDERGKLKDEFLEASDKRKRRSGYASLNRLGKIPAAQIDLSLAGDITGEQIASGTVADARIASTIARDTEITADIATHAAAADPHTGYQKESEKDSANGYAGLDASSKLTPAQFPAISWRYNKNGTNQTSVGTGAEIITWTDASSLSFTHGVTFTDGDDSVKIITPGVYFTWASLQFVVQAANDALDAYVYVDGAADTGGFRFRHNAGADNVLVMASLDLAVDQVITIFGANASNADTVTGTVKLTEWGGFWVGPS